MRYLSCLSIQMTAMTTTSSAAIRLVPLGGLGEIGMNCMALEAEQGTIVIDCGVTFPQSDIGIDVFHPYFGYLEAKSKSVRGIVLTHGHEDHVGGLPYLLRKIDVPVWAPAHAAGLAVERLMDHGFDGRALRLITMVPGTCYELGPFGVEPVRVTHSIADACALVLRTPAGTVVHTGDFKFDPNPSDGVLTDFDRLAEVGRDGVRLLLSDSTNIDAGSTSGSESSVGEAIEPMVAQARARVVVGLFASNVHRLRLFGRIAKRHRRKICLLGRSMHTHVRVATACGALDWPSDLVIPSEIAPSFPRSKIMILASGTQAEPLAALSRLAVRSHPALSLDPGDLLILSSRIIPGNDPAVLRMMGNFIRQGVEVRSRMTDPAVHVSGHAHRDEQQQMIEIIRPQSFIAVHGTLHHLHRHVELARSLGIDDVLRVENGDVIEIDSSSVRKVDQAEVGKVAAFDGEEIPDDVLKEREVLGRTGIVMVSLMIDARGRLLSPPSLSTRGVLDEQEQQLSLRGAALEIAKALDGRPFSVERPGDDQIVEVAQRALRRHFDAVAGGRPVTVVHVVRP